MIINSYPDGSTYPLVNLSNKNFTFRINSNGDIIELLDAYNHNDIIPEVTIPCLYYSQDDNRWNVNSSFNLKLICELLNTKKAKYKIFHPHNKSAIEMLLKNVEFIDNNEFIKNVLGNYITGTTIGHFNEPNQYFDGKNLILMSSDAGGFKPLIKTCDTIKWKGETYSASKARSWDDEGTKFIQQIDREDFKGKDVLIIDDISVYGGTFKGLSKLLKERNCGKLYLAVSHMTVQNLISDPVTDYFDTVFTTNSKYQKYFMYQENWGEPQKFNNLEVITMF